MRKVVNIHAYLKVLQTIWERQGWRLVAEDDFMPRTDGRGLIYYQRSMFDPVWINENPEQWPLAIYALKHEANHNLPNQQNIFKYIRKEKKDMRSFVGYCVNLLWDELNDRLGYRAKIDLEGRLVFSETKWHALTTTPSHKGQIIHTLFAWDCVNRCGWNDLLVPYTEKVIERPSEQEAKWLDVLLRSNYYGKLVRLGNSNEHERGVALWNLTEEILRDVFDYEEDPEEEGSTPTPEGEGGEESEESESDSTEGDDGAESSEKIDSLESTKKAEPEKKESEGKQKVVEVDYEDMLVSPHVSEGNVKKMDTSEAEKFKIDYSKYKGRRYYRHYMKEEFTVVDFETGEITRGY